MSGATASTEAMEAARGATSPMLCTDSSAHCADGTCVRGATATTRYCYDHGYPQYDVQARGLSDLCSYYCYSYYY